MPAAISSLPAFFTLGRDVQIRSSVMYCASFRAAVDLILVTLQYCPNNSRTEPADALVGAFVAALLLGRKERFRALYHHVLLAIKFIYGVLAVILSCCLGILDWCMNVAWRRNNCHSRGIPKTQTKPQNKKKLTNHDCINSTRPCQRRHREVG